MKLRAQEHKDKIGAAVKKFNDEHRGQIKKPGVGEANRLRVLTPEQRANRSKIFSGEHNPFFGKQHSEETNARMSEFRSTHVPPKLLKHGITTEVYFAKISEGFKWCFVHEDWVRGEEFHKGQGACKPCAKVKYRQNRLLKLYGVTEEWFEAKLVEQGGGCGICGSTKRAKNKRMHIDHIHGTTQARGVLCHHCNLALERLDEVPDWTTKALAYLSKYQS